MGFFSGLATLPLAPVRGAAWVSKQVADEADRQLYDEDQIRREMIQLEIDYDDGKIGEEERAEMEDALLERLEISRERAREERREAEELEAREEPPETEERWCPDGRCGAALQGTVARSDGRRSGRSKSGLTGRQAVREAREQLFELIGRPVEQVLAIERDDDGDWQVLVQVVELERIPNSTDVLGAYRVNLDEDGEVVGYRRIRRYVRSQADED